MLVHDFFLAGLLIRIRIGSGFNDFVDPDPDWESGSRIQGQKMKKNKYFFVDFLFIFTTERYKNSTNC
jgi:hypothetical protein